MARIAVTGLRGVPAAWGGVEHHCEELYSRLAANGHDITIYARSFYVKSDIKFYIRPPFFILSYLLSYEIVGAFFHFASSARYVASLHPVAGFVIPLQFL